MLDKTENKPRFTPSKQGMITAVLGCIFFIQAGGKHKKGAKYTQWMYVWIGRAGTRRTMALFELRCDVYWRVGGRGAIIIFGIE